MNMIVQK